MKPEKGEGDASSNSSAGSGEGQVSAGRREAQPHAGTLLAPLVPVAKSRAGPRCLFGPAERYASSSPRREEEEGERGPQGIASRLPNALTHSAGGAPLLPQLSKT